MRVLDVTDAPVTSLVEVWEGSQPARRALLAPGGRPTFSRPALWPIGWAPAEQPHRLTELHADPVMLYAVRDAIVGGAGAQAVVEDAYVWARPAYPGYVRFWIERDETPEAWTVPAGPPTERLERAFTVTHFNPIWGHWLTELYPKLFVIRRLAAQGLTAPILLPSTAPGFVASVIAATLPEQEVVTYNPRRETVTVGTLLLPDMLNRDYVFHEWMSEGIGAEIVRTRRERTPMNDRLFVSRSDIAGPTGYRELINASEIEAEAQARGFAVIRPETMSWSQQIATFAQASVVVGEFGSGLHNTLMSPAGARVLALNWIVDVQSRIGNFRRQDVGYLLPEDGVPRGFSLEAQGPQPFRIDMNAYRRALDRLLDPRDPPPLRMYDALPA